MNHIDVREGPIDYEQLMDSMASFEDGGVVLFLGKTRKRSEGRDVVKLVYDAYVPMARRELEKVVERAKQVHGVEHIAAVHRIGEVPLGEAAVAVVAAAPHRDAAFKACRFVIDETKKTVPIWKNEWFSDGSAWVGDPNHPGGAGAKASSDQSSGPSSGSSSGQAGSPAVEPGMGD